MFGVFSEADSGQTAMLIALLCKNPTKEDIVCKKSNSCSWIYFYNAQDVLFLHSQSAAYYTILLFF